MVSFEQEFDTCREGDVLVIRECHSQNWDKVLDLARANPRASSFTLPSSGWNALHFAVFNKAPLQVLGELIALSQIDVNTPESSGCSCLYYALQNGSCKQVVELLIAHGADPNQSTSSKGMTPLHVAVLSQADPEIILLLLKSGANPNAIVKPSPTMVMLLKALNSDLPMLVSSFLAADRC